MNRIKLFLGIALITLLSVAALADTLYLSNGSVLQGNFLRFENGQFYFQLTDGGDRDRGRVLRFTVREVLRIVTERDPDGTLSKAPPTSPTTPTSTYVSHPNVEVRLTNDWINSNIQVVQGQKIRLEATGTVRLDGRDNSSPAGLNRRDANAPMPNENDGALVASISNDLNAPIIFIGRAKEFVADRSGTLYFTVNHWDTLNASGSYQVRVQTERQGGGRAPVVSSTPFSCGMPPRFTETEGGYNGVWTRRGNSNEYDAIWTRGRQEVTAVLSITTQGNRIYVKRISSSDGYLCEYEGVVGNNGVTITGTYSCGSGKFNWQARAECKP